MSLNIGLGVLDTYSNENIVAMFRDNLFLTLNKAKIRLNNAMSFDATKYNDLLPATAAQFNNGLTACEAIMKAVYSKNFNTLKDASLKYYNDVKNIRESYSSLFSRPSKSGYTSAILSAGARRVVKLIDLLGKAEPVLKSIQSNTVPFEKAVKTVTNAVKFLSKGLCYAIDD